LAALCQRLLARDAGDTELAARELGRAVAIDSGLGLAWRGLAALALGRGDAEEAINHCRRAQAIDPRDERALFMVAGACLRSARHAEAYEATAQVAALRGDTWTADMVLRELTG
jgi:tetratricopeptide (TPR) repeat protein